MTFGTRISSGEKFLDTWCICEVLQYSRNPAAYSHTARVPSGQVTSSSTNRMTSLAAQPETTHFCLCDNKLMIQYELNIANKAKQVLNDNNWN